MAVFTDEGKTYHVRVGKGDIGRYVLLPGDPFRTDLIASYFDDAKLVAHNREHKTWTGTLNGVPVSVVSTGMGCPSTAICLEELIACGADTFIRVGTAGRVCDRAFDPTLDGVINTAAVRDEGTTKHYIPIEYPAVADRHVVAALADSAKQLGYNFIEGITQSKDSFYGQHEPENHARRAVAEGSLGSMAPRQCHQLRDGVCCDLCHLFHPRLPRLLRHGLYRDAEERRGRRRCAAHPHRAG